MLLYKRLKSGEQVAIIDLLRFEESSRTVLVLPERFGFNQLASAIDFRVVTPENMDTVLYCSSAGEFTSARVAVALQKKGISNVWLLEGRLTAWKNEGLPVIILQLSFQVKQRSASE